MFSDPASSDLHLVRSQAVPRDDATARRVAARISPASGFVLYGVVYFLIGAGSIYVFALFLAVLGFAHLLDQVPIPSWALAVSAVAAGAPFALSWWPYLSWVKHRRADGRILGREGTLGEAAVVRCRRRRIQGWPFTIATIELRTPSGPCWAELSIGGHPDELCEGARLTVLTHPMVRHCGAFAINGRLTPAVKRASPPG